MAFRAEVINFVGSELLHICGFWRSHVTWCKWIEFNFAAPRKELCLCHVSKNEHVLKKIVKLGICVPHVPCAPYTVIFNLTCKSKTRNVSVEIEITRIL